LVTTELFANAVNATGLTPWTPKAPPVRLWLLADGDLTGRGLMIISELADWGCYPAPDAISGKVVWTRGSVQIHWPFSTFPTSGHAAQTKPANSEQS
jgi:hypothetical protein